MWSHAGIICTGETYKNVVKLTFAKGASLKDPSGLFNASLEGNTRRAIDIHEGDKIDEKAFKALHSRRRGAQHKELLRYRPKASGASSWQIPCWSCRAGQQEPTFTASKSKGLGRRIGSLNP